ncbi:MAG: GntP family permease [Lysobacterales bacterium]
MLQIFLLIACIVFIVAANKYWRLHPFAALILAAFGYGIAVGMPLSEVATVVDEGFGRTIGSIGIVIVCGAIIAAFLQHSGAAGKLAERILNMTSHNQVPTTMGVVGYLVSMPVFCDSGFVLLSPINRALALRAGASLAACSTALSLGLYATHTMVPPTPGPVAAAGIVGADLGLVIALGVPISIAALCGGLAFAYWSARRVEIAVEAGAAELDILPGNEGPSVVASIMPILLPIVLILLRSFSELPQRPLGDGTAAHLLSFLGQPSVALIIGAALALLLPKKLTPRMLSDKGWIGEAVKAAAVIIVITGAGGAFGRVLQVSGIADSFAGIALSSPFSVLVPVLVAAAIKTAQGSSTVAIITTAGIVAPMLEILGLDSASGKALAVVAIGAGSMMVSHANDSYFWVVTQFSGMSIHQGYRLQTLGSLVQGVAATAAIFLTYWLIT